MLTDNHYEDCLAAATDLGRAEGQSAASWVFDGNTDDAEYQRVLAGIDNGDPEILDELPAADLSGQWADGLTPDGLAELVASAVDGVDAVDLTSRSETLDRICDAYEGAFNDAVAREVEHIAREHLA